MIYETFFYIVIGFILGRISTRTIYIGRDKEQFDAADIGIRLKDR
jgi:hypothetical protein